MSYYQKYENLIMEYNCYYIIIIPLFNNNYQLNLAFIIIITMSISVFLFIIYIIITIPSSYHMFYLIN